MIDRAQTEGETQVLTMQHDTVQTTPTPNDLRPLAPIPRLLIVDANDDTRELYCRSFQLSGCHVVVEAADGRDALTKALVSSPSLVVTEISVPFLDGYALCEIMRPDRATADIPILVLKAAPSRRHGPRTNSRGRHRDRQTDDA